jgi:hypothetical protein
MIISGINTDENEAETRHFINEKESTSRKPRPESITETAFHPTEGHFFPPPLFFPSENLELHTKNFKRLRILVLVK